ncbi:MAG: hypothetical protein DA328_06670 [Nitrososphaeraceae archaeon]|nr:hypothetical protein [Nitrososphaeraceae archaeon]
MNIETNKKLVNDFFKLLSLKDFQSLVSLFSNDATVIEPFSKEGKIMGKEGLSEFFKIMSIASDGLNHSFSFEEVLPENISIISEYQRGNKITARFDFNFRNDNDGTNISNKITELKIMFL